MSVKGNCYGNVIVEAFFKTIKSELVWHTTDKTRNQAQTQTGTFIALSTTPAHVTLP
jgi:putative transposase